MGEIQFRSLAEARCAARSQSGRPSLLSPAILTLPASQHQRHRQAYDGGQDLALRWISNPQRHDPSETNQLRLALLGQRLLGRNFDDAADVQQLRAELASAVVRRDVDQADALFRLSLPFGQNMQFWKGGGIAAIAGFALPFARICLPESQ